MDLVESRNDTGNILYLYADLRRLFVNFRSLPFCSNQPAVVVDFWAGMKMHFQERKFPQYLDLGAKEQKGFFGVEEEHAGENGRLLFNLT